MGEEVKMVILHSKFQGIGLVLAAVLSSYRSIEALSTTPAAYGVGNAGFKAFLSNLPPDFSAVTEGGWFALQNRYVSEVGKDNFSKFKASLPEDTDVVKVGGYDNLMKLAVDPKAELVTLIKNNLSSSGGKMNYVVDGKIDGLVALLQSQGKGFNSVMVDGDWSPVLARQGKKSPRIQKAFNKREKATKALSNFHVEAMEFENLSYTPRSNGVTKAVVKYNPVAENFEIGIDGKVVLRRIACDITDVTFKYWKLPTIPIPLKRSGGYLDFLYLDNDMRITRGNRGGLFVHFRQAFLEELMS